ncbi:ABC transporter permease [Desertivirga arenae]|uniref:ABC transporter permease n=1 Tax=Desertivirga arenae TaxID=2810309 RepID=UPI001A9637B5
MFSIEVSKIKNTALMWFLLIGSLLIPLAVAVSVFEEALKNINIHQEWGSGWYRVLRGSSFFTAPMIMVLIPSFVMDIEYRSSSWKYLLTLPVTRQSIFHSKLLICILGCLFFYLSSFLAYGIAMSVYWFYFPSSGLFDSEFPILQIAILSLRMIISSIAIMILHFGLSLFIKNLIYNIGIGVFGIVLGILTFDWNMKFYFPHSSCLVSMFKSSAGTSAITRYEIISIVLIIISYLSSFWFFRKKFRG